jgi:sulfatase maturation enzyme AslB (radical SAM superfamily)
MTKDCLFPFTHLYIEPKGTVGPCCAMYRKDSNYIIQSAEDLDNWGTHPDLKGIRDHFRTHRDMIEPDCGQCINHERAGVKSMRENMFDRFEPSETNFYYNNPLIRSMHIKFGNLCNLACRTCSEESSSLLEKEFNVEYINDRKVFYASPNKNKRYGDLEWYTRPGVFDKLLELTANIIKLQISGGEPLVNEYFWRLMEHVVTNGYAQNINLGINTNGTVTLKPDQIIMLRSFKSIQFDVSQDATEELSEYIRTRGSWDLWVRNMLQYKEMSKQGMINGDTFHHKVGITISVLNVHKLTPLINFVESHGIRWHYQFVHWPAELAVDNLNDQAKDYLRNLYKDDPRMQFVIKYLDDNKPRLLLETTKQYMDRRDAKALTIYKNFTIFEKLEPTWYKIITQ